MEIGQPMEQFVRKIVVRPGNPAATATGRPTCCVLSFFCGLSKDDSQYESKSGRQRGPE
jgi:hypothetical protein